ncbi:hypothetical protein [Microbacterium immunditiarum]|uniref:Drug/metabolite transporter (DMT)-like permease n=1 Tax=Microbacterium immunditiarum TaxID=337480 RepID=A0A7Y9KJ61_9MICO|nr:hypothetical protein [Microbacterium immunditiarum]NYE21292.1 drug/metabolite transporter (DMT)-like permease [Microbacterium immunditiarum]
MIDAIARDRVLVSTRIVAVAIVPFLVVAAVLLFAFPTRTGELFAWAIDPPLSAYMLGSAYVGGVWFFVRVAMARQWHRVKHGFPAVVVFAGALLVATLLHLDRFSANLSFVVWLILYATTPFVVAALAWAQRREDPGARDGGSTDAGDWRIPAPARWVLIVVGLAALGTGAALFVAPDFAVGVWAWELTPLTAQVTGAVLSLTGVVNLGMVRDDRWSSFRILFQAQLISLVAIAASVIAAWGDLRWDRPATPFFLALVAAALVGYAAFTVWCELATRQEGTATVRDLPTTG